LLERAYGANLGSSSSSGPRREKDLSIKWFRNTLLTRFAGMCGLEHEERHVYERKETNKEVQDLKKRKAAASMLLDQIEAEVIEIEAVLEQKGKHAMRIREAYGSSTLHTTCYNLHAGDDEHELDANGRESRHHEGMVVLRSKLEQQLNETELTLQEKEQELRRLRQELSMYTTEYDQIRGRQDKLVEREEDMKKRVVQRYGAMFDKSKSVSIRLCFVSWVGLVEQRRLTEKRLNKGARAFAKSLERGDVQICFNLWKGLLEPKKGKRDKRKEAVLKKYDALLRSDSESIKHMVVVQWWKITKDSQLEQRMQDVQQTMDNMKAAGSSSHIILKITIFEAKGIRAADFSGKSDPYCICEIPKKAHFKFKTEVRYNVSAMHLWSLSSLLAVIVRGEMKWDSW